MTIPDANGVCNLTPLQTPSLLLTNALHDMAQPLTVLAALLDDAVQAPEPALTGDYLALARGECCRAVAAMQSLQVLSTLKYASADAEGLR